MEQDVYSQLQYWPIFDVPEIMLAIEFLPNLLIDVAIVLFVDPKNIQKNRDFAKIDVQFFREENKFKA